MARKILLADDSVTAQNMGRKILADAGYEVITVNNGSAALKKIAEQRPELIVLDVYMPGYSGLEVCQRLKEAGDTSRIPVLLTVGKLEPFKPEEAKRVRADGFIVKPFEASELLSALSKLEDKIVPRNESSKPGRFPRAAVVEDSRYDKTMSIEEDAGWKNRIAFPSRKKQKEAEQDEPAAYTPALKDVRAVLEPMRVEAPASEKLEDKFDLGALAAAGLPKDVTPEEIAALAAAAARVKGKIVEEKFADAAEMAVVAPSETAVHEAPAAAVPEATSSVLASVVESVENTHTIAETESETTAGSSEVADVIANFEPLQTGAEAAGAGNGSASHETADSAEPVTMAVATMAESVSQASRWTAVAVALAPEDAGISLEQEMQKAYAAFAAAETGHSGSIATGPADFASAGVGASEAAVSVPATLAPEAAQTLTAVASAATEAVSAAVKELESVASAYTAQAPTPLEISSTPPETPAASNAEPFTAEKIHSEPVPAMSESAEALHLRSSGHHAERLNQKSPEQASAHREPVSEPSMAAIEVRPEATPAAAVESAQSLPEPGDTKTMPAESEASAPRDIAAMAAAVGGKVVEDAGALSDADSTIASIVDSVLANLRPKIVEEISRKLGKK